MANADGDQDLVVYAFTKTGSVERANYRNSNITTGNKVPLFVKNDFGAFYGNVFTKQWRDENKSVGFLEYAWDVTPINPMKCDPCVGNPPNEQDLANSGVWWRGTNSQRDWSDYSDVEDEDGNYETGKVYFTRMHFRYNRQSFPQDLMFQVTPNTENFQARYVITHPAQGSFDCPEGQAYLQQLKQRRKLELMELRKITGKDMNTWRDVAVGFNKEDERQETDTQYARLIDDSKNDVEDRHPTGMALLLVMAAAGGAVYLRQRHTV